jgi:hypothetical protein
MNPSEIQGDLLQPPAASVTASPLEELQAQHQSLQTMFVIALISLIFLSFGIIIFIGKQMTNVRAQLEVARPEAANTVTDFKKGGDPLIRNFVFNLQIFASTNRDLVPTLDRYRQVLYPYFSPVVPAFVNMSTGTSPPPIPGSK